MRVSGAATVLHLSSTGGLAVGHASQPDQIYLRGPGLTAVVLDGEESPLPAPQVVADADEAELTYLVPGRLQIVVRHTFAASWGLRIAFSSIGGVPLVLDAATLAVSPAVGYLGWALAAGAEASYVVQPCRGTGLILGGALQSGAVDRVSSTGLHLGRVELAPGGRYVLQWQWDWYATPLQFSRSKPLTVPASLCATVGEALELGRNDDAALIVSGELEVTETEEHLELVSDLAGSHLVEQRSARGTTRVRLRWVPTVEEVLCDRAEADLAQPRTAAGLVKLARLPAALVVQHALVSGLISDTDDTADALDLYTARLTASEPVGGEAGGPERGGLPLVAVYLCGEHRRTGEQDLLDRAVAIVLAADSAAPGLGVAATQVCLTSMLAGRQAVPVLQHLRDLVEHIPAEVDLSRQIAQLELIAVTGAGPGSASAARQWPGTTGSATDLSARVEDLGRRLGAGLKGQAVDPPPLDRAAHLTTVLQLLPDGAAGGLYRRWGSTPQSLAERAVPELVARLDPEVTSLAHVWLMLGQQPR